MRRVHSARLVFIRHARVEHSRRYCATESDREGIDFNGDGTLVSPFATVSINGTIIHSSGSPGTYTVNTDCTGTLSFTGGASFDIFVDKGGKDLWMIQSGPGSPVFEGAVTRVP